MINECWVNQWWSPASHDSPRRQQFPHLNITPRSCVANWVNYPGVFGSRFARSCSTTCSLFSELPLHERMAKLLYWLSLHNVSLFNTYLQVQTLQVIRTITLASTHITACIPLLHFNAIITDSPNCDDDERTHPAFCFYCVFCCFKLYSVVNYVHRASK